jgi:tripartite-type tricarboxylate transporter receptor subunit TctC
MLAGVTLGWQLPKAVFEPGNLAFGSPGHGTINQLAVEWLALEAGIKLLHVPYRGGAAPVNGLAAGDTALGVTTLTSVKASLTTVRSRWWCSSTAKGLRSCSSGPP